MFRGPFLQKMHIFSKALISVSSENITEQLKVLSALGEQELQTRGGGGNGGRSERAERTELPSQASQGRCGGSGVSKALKRTWKPRSHHLDAQS